MAGNEDRRWCTCAGAYGSQYRWSEGQKRSSLVKAPTSVARKEIRLNEEIGCRWIMQGNVQGLNDGHVVRTGEGMRGQETGRRRDATVMVREELPVS